MSLGKTIKLLVCLQFDCCWWWQKRLLVQIGTNVFISQPLGSCGYISGYHWMVCLRSFSSLYSAKCCSVSLHTMLLLHDWCLTLKGMMRKILKHNSKATITISLNVDTKSHWVHHVLFVSYWFWTWYIWAVPSCLERPRCLHGEGQDISQRTQSLWEPLNCHIVPVKEFITRLWARPWPLNQMSFGRTLHLNNKLMTWVFSEALSFSICK